MFFSFLCGQHMMTVKWRYSVSKTVWYSRRVKVELLRRKSSYFSNWYWIVLAVGRSARRNGINRLRRLVVTELSAARAFDATNSIAQTAGGSSENWIYRLCMLLAVAGRLPQYQYRYRHPEHHWQCHAFTPTSTHDQVTANKLLYVDISYIIHFSDY